MRRINELVPAASPIVERRIQKRIDRRHSVENAAGERKDNFKTDIWLHVPLRIVAVDSMDGITGFPRPSGFKYGMEGPVRNEQKFRRSGKQSDRNRVLEIVWTRTFPTA